MYRYTLLPFLLLTMAIAPVHGLAAGSENKPRIPDAPPRPVVVADGGAHRLAVQGTYCWETATTGICVDSTDPMDYAPLLHAPAESTVTIRMGHPTTSLEAYTTEAKLDLIQLDERRRKFELTLPPSASGKPIEIYLQADYEEGDGLFAVRIKPREW